MNKLAPNFPAALLGPIDPSVILVSTVQPTAAGTVVSLSATSSHSAQEVIAYYQQVLTANGFVAGNPAQPQGALYATFARNAETVNVTALALPNGTSSFTVGATLAAQ